MVHVATMRASDAVILQAVSEVLRGNSEAYEIIVSEYERPLLRLATSFLGNPEEAEEAVQDIFITAYRKLDSFSLERRFYPWLYTVALNMLRSRYRRNRTRGVKYAEIPEDIPSSLLSPEEESLRDEARVALRAAVDRLPGKLREVVILYYFQDESVATIAEVLKAGEENVKSRLFRARKKIRETLERKTGT